MKKINWRNLIELIGVIVFIVLAVIFFIKANDTELVLNYLISSYLTLTLGLCLGYDIFEKIRG